MVTSSGRQRSAWSIRLASKAMTARSSPSQVPRRSASWERVVNELVGVIVAVRDKAGHGRLLGLLAGFWLFRRAASSSPRRTAFSWRSCAFSKQTVAANNCSITDP